MSYNFTHAKNNCKHKIRVPILEVCANCGTWSTATIMARLLQPIFFSFFFIEMANSFVSLFLSGEVEHPQSHFTHEGSRRNILSHNKHAACLEIPNVLPRGKAGENSKTTLPEAKVEEWGIWKKIKRGNE